MVTVLGVFSDERRALDLIESLRSARFDTDAVRLVGGTNDVAEFAARAGPSANVAAGPPSPVLRGLVESDLSDEDLRTIEQRVEGGAVVLLARDLDSDGAAQLVAQLREHHAEGVISSDATGQQA